MAKKTTIQEDPQTLNRHRIIAVSKSNKGIKYSDDNGETWNYSNIKSGSFKKPVQFTNGIILVRCAEIGDCGILYTEDGGKIWKPTSLGTGYYHEIIETPDGSLLTSSVLQNGKSYKSKDGKVWKEIKALGDNFLFLKSDEITVGNSAAYIASLTESFGSIKTLIGNNNNNVHKMQKELMLLQKRAGFDITSEVTGGADPDEFIDTHVEDVDSICDALDYIQTQITSKFEDLEKQISELKKQN